MGLGWCRLLMFGSFVFRLPGLGVGSGGLEVSSRPP